VVGERVRSLLRGRDFRFLIGTRLASQAGDGALQLALAGYVLFNPERSTTAADAAAAFATLLLPYSVVGPFAGVFIDRWNRRRTLIVASVIRAAGVLVVAAIIVSRTTGVPLYAGALLLVSANRFVLSALSAGLPLVVDRDRLVLANAVSVTAGTVATFVAGGGLGLAVRTVVGSGALGNAAAAVTAAALYVGAAAIARGLAADALGPEPDPRRPAAHEAMRAVAGRIAAGARHVRERRPAARALLAIGAHRFCYGISTVSALLLYRNYFTDRGFFRSGLPGLLQVFAASAAGVAIAVVVTPAGARRFGLSRWICACFALAAAAEIGLGLLFTQPALLAAAFLLGAAAQGSKICVDSLVQATVDDAFRGRVFSFYDLLFNVSFVAAAVTAAFLLPDSGRSPLVIVLIATGYAGTAAAYAVASRARGEPDPVSP
jgi:MFS family permease